MASHSSLALQSQSETQFSSISAAPALLPGAPLSSSPTLSPDISPLFPSPGGVPLSPSDPSPPNPEVNVAPEPGPPLVPEPGPALVPEPGPALAPEPGLALAPSGSPPVSHAVSVTSSLPINVTYEEYSCSLLHE
ncbi:unnamed protein product [Malus baccata var. baccata]